MKYGEEINVGMIIRRERDHWDKRYEYMVYDWDYEIGERFRAKFETFKQALEWVNNYAAG